MNVRRFTFLWTALLPLLMLLPYGLTVAQDEALALSEPGIYVVGTRDMSLTDDRRDDRRIGMTIWYPAAGKAKTPSPTSAARRTR
jgi:hypothetical protein